MNKYNARRVSVDSITYASQREANRHQELLMLQRVGEIADIELQPKYPIYLNGIYICTYIADYRYRIVASGDLRVEDTKGFRTPVYKLKKKLVEAYYGITISEI